MPNLDPNKTQLYINGELITGFVDSDEIINIDSHGFNFEAPKEYKTRVMYSVNDWEYVRTILNEEWLEKTKTFYIHFVDVPRDKINDIPEYDANDLFKYSNRILAKAQYIGNLEGNRKKIIKEFIEHYFGPTEFVSLLEMPHE